MKALDSVWEISANMPGEFGEFHAAQRAAILPILHVLTEGGVSNCLYPS